MLSAKLPLISPNILSMVVTGISKMETTTVTNKIATKDPGILVVNLLTTKLMAMVAKVMPNAQ